MISSELLIQFQIDAVQHYARMRKELEDKKNEALNAHSRNYIDELIAEVTAERSNTRTHIKKEANHFFKGKKVSVK